MSLPRFQQVALDQIADDIESFDNGATPPANLMANYRPLTPEELLAHGDEGRNYQRVYFQAYHSELTRTCPDFLLWFPDCGDYLGYSDEEIEAADLKGWQNFDTFMDSCMDGSLFSEFLSDPTYKARRLEWYEYRDNPHTYSSLGGDEPIFF